MERENYTFVGFNHNGTVYQVNEDGTDYLKGETSLAQVIASSYKETDTVELTAVWKSAYGDTRFTFTFSAGHGDDPVYYYDTNKDLVEITYQTNYITFDDSENYDLNDSLYTFFFQGKSPVILGSDSYTGEYTIYYAITSAGLDRDLIMYSTNEPGNVTFADILALREGSQIITIVFDFN